MIYRKGIPDKISINWKESFQWNKKAAEQGHAEAQLILGFSYSSGEGIEQDDRQAFLWVMKAAESCSTMAQT